MSPAVRLDLGNSSSSSPRTHVGALLTRPEIRRYLEAYVRRRVPIADAEDVIQAVLCAALEAKEVPSAEDECRMWLTGVARRKIAGLYQQSSREELGDDNVEQLHAGPAPLEAASMLRWAERQAAQSDADEGRAGAGAQTLEWMARESDGEKLESIAADVNVPATRVRQRVSRMRRWMKTQWVAELMATLALVLVSVSVVIWWLAQRQELRLPDAKFVPIPQTLPDVNPSEPPRNVESPELKWAHELRIRAARACESRQFESCLKDLDDAARLDVAGDSAPTVKQLRLRIADALRPLPPSPAPRPIPTTSGTTHMGTPSAPTRGFK